MDDRRHEYSATDCAIRRANGVIDDPANLAERDEPEHRSKLEAHQASLQADVQDALAKLTPRQREIVRLSINKGLPVRAAAEALKIPIATYHDDYKRTKRRLVVLLDAYRPAE